MKDEWHAECSHERGLRIAADATFRLVRIIRTVKPITAESIAARAIENVNAAVTDEELRDLPKALAINFSVSLYKRWEALHVNQQEPAA